MHEHYHEAFWVVTGTAAPLIALAIVVVMGDTLSALPRHMPKLPRRDWTVSWSARIAGFTFAITLALLALSLFSLGKRSDEVPLPVAGATALLGLAGVYAATFMVPFIRTASWQPKNREARVSDGRVRRLAVKRGLVGSQPVRRRHGPG